MDIKDLKINFLGDSITEGYCATNRHGYVDFVADYTGALCRNYGIAGTRIARQQKPSEEPKFDKDFCSRVDTMDKDADYVFIFGGTNDYDHGDAPFGNMSDRTPDTFYGALHTLFKDVTERFLNSEIAVITPMHRSGEYTSKNKANGLYLKSYVDAIREVAEYYSLPLIDLYKDLGIQPDLPLVKEKYTTDGLHPNDLGHQKIAKIIVNYIKRNI